MAAGLLTCRGFVNKTMNLESCLQLVCDRRIMTIERECGRCGEQMHWERDAAKTDGGVPDSVGRHVL